MADGEPVGEETGEVGSEEGGEAEEVVWTSSAMAAASAVRSFDCECEWEGRKRREGNKREKWR